MSISCSGGKTTIAKWSDVIDLATQIDVAAVTLNITLANTCTSFLYTCNSAFSSTDILLRFTFQPTVTDPCSQIIKQEILYTDGSDWIPDVPSGQNPAFLDGRLYYIGAHPTTSASANNPCFCCLVGIVEFNGAGGYRLGMSSLIDSCVKNIDFSNPCLSGSGASRAGILNTSYLTEDKYIPGPRQPGREVGGFFLITQAVCNGSSDLVTYAYSWESARSRYEIANVDIPLHGYFGWNINANDFTDLITAITNVLNASCGAQANKFYTKGTSTRIPSFCPVAIEDLVWTLQHDGVINADPGCFNYSSGALHYPWSTLTGGATSICSDKFPMYCNTLLQIQKIINKLYDLEAYSISCQTCCPVDSPTLLCDSISASKTKCGYPEFSGHVSTPPKIYLVSSLSGTGTRTAYWVSSDFGGGCPPPGSHPPNCTGCEGGDLNCKGLDVFTLSGSCSIDHLTCAETSSANYNLNVYSPCDTLVSNGDESITCSNGLCSAGSGFLCETFGSPSYTSTVATISIDDPCDARPVRANGTFTDTLSSEYTTDMLKSAVVAALPSYPGTWTGTCSSFANLSTDEKTYSIRRFRYKFMLPSITPGACYKITWLEGSTPMTYIWNDSDTETPVYEVMEPGTNGTVSISSIVVSCPC
jgi:hypothetical protein